MLNGTASALRQCMCVCLCVGVGVGVCVCVSAVGASWRVTRARARLDACVYQPVKQAGKFVTKLLVVGGGRWCLLLLVLASLRVCACCCCARVPTACCLLLLLLQLSACACVPPGGQSRHEWWIACRVALQRKSGPRIALPAHRLYYPVGICPRSTTRGFCGDLRGAP
jgi:hypothetical protein